MVSFRSCPCRIQCKSLRLGKATKIFISAEVTGAHRSNGCPEYRTFAVLFASVDHSSLEGEKSIALDVIYLHGKEIGEMLKKASRKYTNIGGWAAGLNELEAAVVQDAHRKARIRLTQQVFLAIPYLDEAQMSVTRMAYGSDYYAG